jgi:hypothetical protein
MNTEVILSIVAVVVVLVVLAYVVYKKDKYVDVPRIYSYTPNQRANMFQNMQLMQKIQETQGRPTHPEMPMGV